MIKKKSITIGTNKKQIDAFKEKIGKAGSKVKAKYNKEVMALGQKNRDLKKKIKEYQNEGQSKWGEFKKNVKHDADGIGKTVKDLFKDKQK